MKKLMISAIACAVALGASASMTGNWFEGGIGPSSWTQTGWTNTAGSEWVTDHVDVDAAYNAPLTYTADAYAIDSSTLSLTVGTTVKFTPFKYAEMPAATGKAGVIVAGVDGDDDDLHYYVLAKDGGVNKWVKPIWGSEPEFTADVGVEIEVKIFRQEGVTYATYTIDGEEVTVELDAAADYEFSKVSYAGSGEVANVLGDREEAASSGTEVVPGVPTEFDTLVEAEAAVVALDSAQEALTSEQQTTYKELFQAVITGDGPYTVTFELTTAAQTAIDADIAEGAAELAELKGDADSVTIDTIPGLYYSISKGTSLDGMEEGERTMATSDSLTFPVGAIDGSSGFYQILVNAADKD